MFIKMLSGDVRRKFYLSAENISIMGRVNLSSPFQREPLAFEPDIRGKVDGVGF